MKYFNNYKSTQVWFDVVHGQNKELHEERDFFVFFFYLCIFARWRAPLDVKFNVKHLKKLAVHILKYAKT